MSKLNFSPNNHLTRVNFAGVVVAQFAENPCPKITTQASFNKIEINKLKEKIKNPYEQLSKLK